MSFKLLRLNSYPIYEQLLLEEALLRSSSENWCIINTGSPTAIVMGISGKKEELIDCEKAAQQNIPLIKRFSGGGTVLVDENTLFITFISQKQIHSFPAYPEPIMRWSEEIYRQAFGREDFQLKENDFVLGNRKCGGNAQYIKKDRWLHHTSFLWDYSPEKMQLLLHPKKTPTYRQERAHGDFICKLSDYFESQESLIEQFVQVMNERFGVVSAELEDALEIRNQNARLSTSFTS